MPHTMKKQEEKKKKKKNKSIREARRLEMRKKSAAALTLVMDLYPSRPTAPSPPSPPSPHPIPSLPGMGNSRAARRRQRRKRRKEKLLEAVDLEKLDNTADLEKSSTRVRGGLISYSRGLQMYPFLSPRFPKQKETLSFDLGFDQTPTLRKIQAHYAEEYVPSARHILSHSLRPDSKLRLNLRDVYSVIASSVVAVSSFFGVERKVDCSGFLVSWSSDSNEGTVLTSARVLYNPENSGCEFHLIVRMADGTLFLAEEDHVDFYHNILTLKVKSKVELKVFKLRADIVGPGAIGLGQKFVTLGRSFYDYSFLDYIGELDLVYSIPSFGCSELLRSSCYASQICEGGPLITTAGDVVGISFFGNGACAHVLPAHIILSCLDMWKSFSTITRPWFGFSLIDLWQAHFQICEKLHLSHRKACVLVNEVFEGSVADKNDVHSHDLIASLNGTRIESAHQYLDLLSRGVTDLSDARQSFVVCIDRVGRSKEVSFSAEYLSIDDTRFCDCWPPLEVEEWCREKVGSQKTPQFCWPPSPEEETC